MDKVDEVAIAICSVFRDVQKVVEIGTMTEIWDRMDEKCKIIWRLAAKRAMEVNR